MKNGIRIWIVGIFAIAVSGALAGCGSANVQTVAKAAPTAYPAPDVQIVAQPVLASYNQKAVSQASTEYGYGSDETYSSRRRHHKHSRHKKMAHVNSAGADPDMGYMAADDPKLLQAQIAEKESHYKDWALPDKGPSGR